jgi:hypothetical protein
MKDFCRFILVFLILAGTVKAVFANNDLADTDDGIRLEAGLGFGGFSDFHTDSQSKAAYAQYLRGTSDPTFTDSAPAPSSYQEFTVEKVTRSIPVLDIKLPSFIELGIPFSIFPSGNYVISNSDSSGFDTATISLLTLSMGLNLRFVFEEGPFQFYLEGGPMLAGVFMDYNETAYKGVGATTTTASGSAINFPIGGQGQLGADLNLGNGFLISTYIGYRSLTASDIESVITVQSGLNSAVGMEQFNMLPTPYGYQIAFVPQSQANTVGRPMTIDYNAFLTGIQIGAYF